MGSNWIKFTMPIVSNIWIMSHKFDIMSEKHITSCYQWEVIESNSLCPLRRTFGLWATNLISCQKSTLGRNSDMTRYGYFIAGITAKGNQMIHTFLFWIYSQRIKHFNIEHEKIATGRACIYYTLSQTFF